MGLQWALALKRLWQKTKTTVNKAAERNEVTDCMSRTLIGRILRGYWDKGREIKVLRGEAREGIGVPRRGTRGKGRNINNRGYQSWRSSIMGVINNRGVINKK